MGGLHLDSPSFLTHKDHAENCFNDISRLKVEIDKLRENKDQLTHVVFEIGFQLPFAMSGVMYPLANLHNVYIQGPDSEQQGFIYNVIPMQERSLILLSSVKTVENNLYTHYLKDIESKIMIDCSFVINYLLAFFIYDSENILFRPSWYKALPSDLKKRLSNLEKTAVGRTGDIHSIKMIDFVDCDKPVILSSNL